jgi:AraC-like DNA-binding protein
MSSSSDAVYGGDPGAVSVRILWPFARLVPNAERDLEAVGHGAIDASLFTDPDGRIPVSIYRKLLLRWRDKTGDPALGIHASELLDTADFEVLHRAVRNSASVREALLCYGRYMTMLADNLSAVLDEDAERATWQIRYQAPSVLAVSNDFMVTTAWRAMHLVLAPTSLYEVHVRHDAATNAEEYARVFRAPVRFGRAHNALVFPLVTLDLPLLHASSGLFEAFNQRAQLVLERLKRGMGVDARVKELLVEHLHQGEFQITHTARRLEMSAATLRRRLAEQGTTYTELLDQVRRYLALQRLQERRLMIGEIAFLLGFSSQSAFGRAFRRWFGMSPAAFRLRADACPAQPSMPDQSSRLRYSSGVRRVQPRNQR